MLIAADHLHAKEALAETADHLSRPRSDIGMLFEPGFSHDDVRVRVDAFRTRDEDGDTLIEVKSTTSVKDEHLSGRADRGLRADRAALVRVLHAHVDSTFVYRKEGHYDGLMKVRTSRIRSKPSSRASDRPILEHCCRRAHAGHHHRRSLRRSVPVPVCRSLSCTGATGSGVPGQHPASCRKGIA